MASRTLNVTITGDARSLNRALDSVHRQTGVTEGRISKFSNTAKAAFATAGIAAGGLLAAGLIDSVKAAREAEVSQAKLQAQLRASGISFRDNAAEIGRVIQKTSQLSGLDDEDLQDAFTNIIRVTGDVSQSLRLTGLAADFARAKHLDVAKAGEIVAKVAGGNTGILSRYGIAIERGATATQALGVLQQKFSGQAAAYGRTAAGAQDRFRVAVENLQEAIGKRLLPAVTRITNAAATFINQMQSGTGAGGRFAKSLREIADAFRPLITLATRVGAVISANMDKIAKAVSIATIANRALLSVFKTIANAELAVASGAGKVASAMGGALKSAANGVASVFRSVAGAIQSVLDKVNALLSLIPHIKFPKFPHIPGISSAGVAIRPDTTPGPSLQTQVRFGESDVELAQTTVTPGAPRVKALQHRQKLIVSRLNQVRKRKAAVIRALRKRLKPKTRRAFIEEEIALIDEEAALVGELNSTASEIASTGSDASADEGAVADTPFDTGGSADTGGVGDTTVTQPDTSLADAINANTQELAALRASMDATRNFAQSVTATEAGAMSRWVTEVISKQMGFGISGRSLTPSYGVARRS